MILLAIIREWITFAADISILFITIYTFYLTFISKRIKFMSIGKSLSDKYGNSFSVILENKSLSPLIIEEISLIIDNQYKVQMKKFNSPLILKAFISKKIASEGYSYTAPEIPLLTSRNVVLEVKTSRKKLYLRMHKNNKKVSKKMRSAFPNVTKVRNTYNENIIPKNAQFVLVTFKEELQKTVFIFKSGMMTEEILGINGIPTEAVKDKASLICFLDNWFEPNGIKYNVNELDNILIESPEED